MKRPSWPHCLWLVGSIAALAGCAQKGPAPLYIWEDFPRQQYTTLLRDSPGTEPQLSQLEAHAEKSRGANAALPPGFRAHLGMLYLNAGNPDKARELWLSEKAAFPESAPYMDRLLQRLGVPAATVAKENPT